MIKQLKYIAAFVTSLGTCYAGGSAITAYINGPNVDYGSATTIRNDVILIGNSAGGFNGLNTPTGQTSSTTTIWHIEIVDGSGGVASNNGPATASTGTAAGLYPSTLTDLWITGNATGIDTSIGATQANALPTPVANVGGASSVPVNIHFLLSNAPAVVPTYWFTQAVPNYTRILIEPGSADPGIDSILSELLAKTKMYSELTRFLD